MPRQPSSRSRPNSRFPNRDGRSEFSAPEPSTHTDMCFSRTTRPPSRLRTALQTPSRCSAFKHRTPLFAERMTAASPIGMVQHTATSGQGWVTVAETIWRRLTGPFCKTPSSYPQAVVNRRVVVADVEDVVVVSRCLSCVNWSWNERLPATEHPPPGESPFCPRMASAFFSTRARGFSACKALPLAAENPLVEGRVSFASCSGRPARRQSSRRCRNRPGYLNPRCAARIRPWRNPSMIRPSRRATVR